MSAHQLPLSAITADPACQPRAAMYRETVEDYARAMVDGATFPPLVIFFDAETHWLADGFHRHMAAEVAGIEADVREGAKRAAILYSVAANTTPGMRRTSEDKRGRS
jgi:hypothetical protein